MFRSNFYAGPVCGWTKYGRVEDLGAFLNSDSSAHLHNSAWVEFKGF
jgi:hypothetical protein